ncbi:MAG: hypothetical protein KDI03_00810 [Anaerolineae bacterium]|nr:hypothetical protein [Anaerolineae bacterium]
MPDSVVIPSVPVPDLNLNTPANWSSDLDSLPSAVPVVDQPDASIYAVNAFYPESPVVVGEAQIQNGQKVLPVRVFPFQYNPITHQVRYHPDIEVTVTVSGAGVPETTATVAEDYSGQAVPETAGRVLRIHTEQRGFYHLTYDDLLAAGVTVGPGGRNPNNFAMVYKGDPIDIQLTGADDNSFDQGDLVVFYAVPYDLGRYQDYNVYYFLEDGAAYASQIASRPVTASFTPTTASAITQTLHVEQNLDYRSTYERPKRDDHFFDTAVFANVSTPVVTRTYALTLDDPLAVSGDAKLSAVIHGGDDSNVTFNPDQSMRLRFNNQDIGMYQWDGSVDYTVDEIVPAASLQTNSSVDLTVALNQLPGITSYWVSPDWVELTYPALADAENDRMFIEGVVAGGDNIVTTGFSTSSVSVYDVRDPIAPKLLSGVGAQLDGSSYSIYWTETEAQPAYFLTTETAILAPIAIEVDQPSGWRSPTNDFDYIAIIGTERNATGTTSLGAELGNAVQPLLDHRSAEGLLVAKVNLQDVYDEFSNGFVDPDAIRAFLTYAYNNWQRQPRYVLLVGDGHYAFRNEVSTALHNTLPPYLVHVDPWIGEVPADSRFVSVDGEDDYLPEMAIGRIPANSAADVTAVVNKTLAYEDAVATPDGDWNLRSVYVADNYSDPAGDFHALSDNVRLNWLPSLYTGQQVYYRMDPDHDTGPEMRTAIKNAFNQGAVFLQWFGHGSTVRWGSVSMYNILDPANLTPTGQTPLTMHNACWTGYFAVLSNNYQALGETLVSVPNKGSVADYSPSGLHIGAALLTLDQGMHKAMFKDRIPRAGDVVKASKDYFFANSLAYHDLIDSMIFFGDPALELRLPTADFSDSTMEVSETTADPGDTLNYTVTLTNTSVFTAPNVILTADYPQNLVTVVDAGGAVDNGDTLTWTLSDVRTADADSAVKTFSLAVNSGLAPGLYNVTVPGQITSDISSPADLQVNTEVNAAPLMVNSTLLAQRAWIPPGMPVTVTAMLLNYGTAPSLGTQVTLTLPSELGEPTWMAASTGSTPVYDAGARQVLWSGDITIGSDETVSFSSIVSPTLTACGTFTVTGEVTDTLGVLTPLDVAVNLAVPDVNCTGSVNVVDVQLVAGRWGATLGQPEYLYEYDLNGNDAIDVNDIIIAANHWE